MRVLPLVFTLVACGAVLAKPAGANPTPIRVGDLTIVSASDTNQRLTHGGSSTQFVLALPKNSTCPGDSANDDWRTQGFLAPVGTDPATIQYNAVGATGPGVFPLYEVNSRSYRNELLEPNTQKGQPGQIPNLPPMTFAIYPPNYVPPGRYVIGIACTYFRALDKYWTTTVDVVKDAKDSPAQLTWAQVGAPTSTSTSGANRTPIVILLLAAAGVGVYVIVQRSQRSRKATAATTSSRRRKQ